MRLNKYIHVKKKFQNDVEKMSSLLIMINGHLCCTQYRIIT